MIKMEISFRTLKKAKEAAQERGLYPDTLLISKSNKSLKICGREINLKKKLHKILGMKLLFDKDVQLGVAFLLKTNYPRRKDHPLKGITTT